MKKLDDGLRRIQIELLVCNLCDWVDGKMRKRKKNPFWKDSFMGIDGFKKLLGIQ